MGSEEQTPFLLNDISILNCAASAIGEINNAIAVTKKLKENVCYAIRILRD